MEKRQYLKWVVVGMVISVLLASGVVSAQDFPTRPIEVIVGFAPGGGTDLIARAVADVAPKYLGQPFMVINKPGAAGTIAAQAVASAKPDGYTILVAGGSETLAVPHFRSLPYKALEDFEPVIRLIRQRILISVKVDSPWKTMQEFLTDARRNPEKYSYASSGVGGLYHAAALVVEKKTGIRMRHIPYKGGAETLAALAGGHVDISLSGPDEAYGLIEGGKVRPLAITSDTRYPFLSNIPTMRELGYDAWLENMKGFVVPKGTPQAIVRTLHDRLRKVFDDPQFNSTMDKLKMETAYLNGEDFKKALKAMSDQIGESVKK